ncbi:MAG: ATP-binding protein [Nanoarchaeota archaeon]|nr:ATP-binding protein [Nanoarchaeota archaeon]
MKTITLEDHVLTSRADYSAQQLKPYIENLKIELIRKEVGTDSQVMDLHEDTITTFGGIYEALKSRFMEGEKKLPATRAAFMRAYMSYVASEAILGQEEPDGPVLSETLEPRRPYRTVNISFGETDSRTLTDIVKQYSDMAGNCVEERHARKSRSNFFTAVSETCKEKLSEPGNKKLYEAFQELEVQGRINGGSFSVRGISGKRKIAVAGPKQEAVKHRKGLEQVMFENVYESEIFGNNAAIELVKTEVSCLMYYDPSERRNPWDGFKQYLLLVGKPGTGKTMLSHFAATYAKEIEGATGKVVNIVGLDFEDRFQYGPLDNIRAQLKQVSYNNQIYLVVIDELETKIPSREAQENHKSDVAGEFLRFRGQGGYINRGNYIILGTTNEPHKLDSAVLDVFEVAGVEGPKTAKEKVSVLYKRLETGLKEGSVKVQDWQSIADLLIKHDLSGREIKNVADSSLALRRILAGRMKGYSLTASEVEQRRELIFKSDGMPYTATVDYVIHAIEGVVQKREEKTKSYLR